MPTHYASVVAMAVHQAWSQPGCSSHLVGGLVALADGHVATQRYNRVTLQHGSEQSSCHKSDCWQSAYQKQQPSMHTLSSGTSLKGDSQLKQLSTGAP